MGGLRPQPKVPRSLTVVGDEDDEDEEGGKEEEEKEEYLSDCSGSSGRRSLHPSRPHRYPQPGRRCNVAEEDPPRRPRVRRDW